MQRFISASSKKRAPSTQSTLHARKSLSVLACSQRAALVHALRCLPSADEGS